MVVGAWMDLMAERGLADSGVQNLEVAVTGALGPALKADVFRSIINKSKVSKVIFDKI